MAAEALIAESTRTLAVSRRICDFMGLWTCAVGIPATSVCLAHKASTTVCPPPLSDTSYGGFTPIDDTDFDTTTGCHSAGAQIDLVAAVCRLYDGKCIVRVLRNYEASPGAVLNMEATDGLPSVVNESVDRIVSPRVSLRITIGEA